MINKTQKKQQQTDSRGEEKKEKATILENQNTRQDRNVRILNW